MIHKLKNLIISLLLLVVLGSVFQHFPYEADKEFVETSTEFFEVENLGSPYTVCYVYDGDTIAVLEDGQEVKIRFIGVDTPESVHKDESLNSPEGEKASSFTKELLEGEQVYLVYDVDEEDDYGRKLAYVFTKEKEMVNAILLEKGYGKCMSIAPNTKYADVFSEIEQSAKENNVGFWKTGFFE